MYTEPHTNEHTQTYILMIRHSFGKWALCIQQQFYFMGIHLKACKLVLHFYINCAEVFCIQHWKVAKFSTKECSTLESHSYFGRAILVEQDCCASASFGTAANNSLLSEKDC